MPTTFSSGDFLDGKYRIVSLIGVGGMALVYRAHDEALGRDVAIKALRPGQGARREVVERFRREARVMSSLSDPHVVQVFEVAEMGDGTPFIVTELLRGCDLRTLLMERGPLPMTDAVDYVMQACDGTAVVHGAGFVHRDLKPSNLFLTVSHKGCPMVKILDFGICKIVEADDGLSTMALSTLGTPRYMSPEQIRSSKSTDARTDVWALGVILFELLTKGAPFHADSQAGILGAVLSDAPRALRAFRPDAPPELEAVILRALAKDKEERFGSAEELRDALSPFGSPRTRAVGADLRARLMASLAPVPLPEEARTTHHEPEVNTVLARGRARPLAESAPRLESSPETHHLTMAEIEVLSPQHRAGTAWRTRLGAGLALALALAAIAWAQSQPKKAARIQEEAGAARARTSEVLGASDRGPSDAVRLAAPVARPQPDAAAPPQQVLGTADSDERRSLVPPKHPTRHPAGRVRKPSVTRSGSGGTSATPPAPAAKFDSARPLHL